MLDKYDYLKLIWQLAKWGYNLALFTRGEVKKFRGSEFKHYRPHTVIKNSEFPKTLMSLERFPPECNNLKYQDLELLVHDKVFKLFKKLGRI